MIQVRLWVLLALMSVAPLAGCGVADGGFTYRVFGRLTDLATSAPLPHHRLRVQCDTISERATAWLATDSAGVFEVELRTGLRWGGMVIPFVAPRAPEPPQLTALQLQVEGQGDWQAVPISPEQEARARPGERWVDLGTVTVWIDPRTDRSP